jgi:hypothetical protein
MLSIVTSFATLVTAHVALCAGFVTRRHPWQTVLAFVFPPLAPYFGFVDRLRVRSLLWCLAALAYAGSRVAQVVLTP